MLEVIALGELNLTPEQFGKYTVSEIDAMFDGYLRRYDALEDLMIINCALPTYRGAYGRKAPTYKKLTKHRRKRNGPVPKWMRKKKLTGAVFYKKEVVKC